MGEGRGHGKADIVREVALILYHKSVPNADKREGVKKSVDVINGCSLPLSGLSFLPIHSAAKLIRPIDPAAQECGTVIVPALAGVKQSRQPQEMSRHASCVPSLLVLWVNNGKPTASGFSYKTA